MLHEKPSLFTKIKTTVLGKARNPRDHQVFHNLSLIAFFAWVGLGADGLSSSCYGPQEAFVALGNHTYLSFFLALGLAATVFIISACYSQIIELFPAGGGGYLVASKLLSPSVGMVSGCALLIDYVLTITISVASGADAIFSFLPIQFQVYKFSFAVVGVFLLIILNLRGVKESVVPLVPIFLLFVVTHLFAILYSLIVNWHSVPSLASSTATDFSNARAELGFFGVAFLLLKAYSMGAGTFTGIEAVSNGLPILREPRVKTGKRTMLYMSVSLAFTVMGLIIAYLLFGVQLEPGRTLNASLFDKMTLSWHPVIALIFVLATLVSEALLLFIGAQAGFLGGPRVLANMAVDRWFPTKFASLSDRLVTQNGVLFMGTSALGMMLLTGGSVRVLVVLYSINVFITFCLSQLGMVRHWWEVRDKEKSWISKITLSGVGLFVTTFILCSVVFLKFHEGGWITLFITGSLVVGSIFIKRHYLHTAKMLRRLNDLVQSIAMDTGGAASGKVVAERPYDPTAKTAVLLVNGFNGLGLHTLFNVVRFFGKEFKNFVFLQVGVVDAGNFKGVEEVGHLQEKMKSDLDRYINYMKRQGFYAEGFSCVGTDVIDEIEKVTPEIMQRFAGAIFFGGQLVFPKESLLTRWLHNYTVFAMQRRFYSRGIPFVILPIRVDAPPKMVA